MEAIGGFIVYVAYIAYFALLVGVFINCSKKRRTSNRSKYVKKRSKNIDDYVNEFGEGILEYRNK